MLDLINFRRVRSIKLDYFLDFRDLDLGKSIDDADTKNQC